MKYKLIVTVDTNDANYLTEDSTIGLEEVNEISSLFSRLSREQDYSIEDWEWTEDSVKYFDSIGLSEGNRELLFEMMPMGEYGSRLESVKIIPFEEEIILF